MPYLPPKVIADDAFTRADDDSLQTHLGLIREAYYRFYPIVEWQMMNYVPTESREGGEAHVAGEAGSTIIDVLYNEAVPANVDPSPEFTQTHGDTDEAEAVDASVRRVWKPVVRMPVNVTKFPTRIGNRNTKSGQSGARSLQLIVATVVADELDLTINAGDIFNYRGNTYEIKEAEIPEHAYWQEHTNIPLFIECFAAMFRIGS